MKESTITIEDPFGLNGHGDTWKRLNKTKARFEQCTEPLSTNDSLKSKKYFSRQEATEQRVEAVLKTMLPQIRAGVLKLTDYICTEKLLTIKFILTK